jgi:rhamnosyl/mannosyltransferase
MRILHLGKYFSPCKGGVESYTRDVMNALQHRGVESAALVHQHLRGLNSRDEIVSLGNSRFRVVRASVIFTLLFTPISLSFPRLLRKLNREFKPDLLHIHLPNASAFWVLTSRSARKLPWVVHWHADVVASSPMMKAAYFFYGFLERMLIRRADAIILTSNHYLESSKPLAGFRDKCQVIPLGVDAARLKQLAETNTQGQPDGDSMPLRVLAVGRLTYYKGFEYLIKAAAIAANIRIIIVGSGDRENQLKSLTRDLGLQEKVRFCGNLSDQELVRQYTLCDCVCLPSLERTEAFGIVLLEAMYFAKAILVSRIPGTGMNWLVEEGVTGMKFEPADTKSLAGVLDRLSADRKMLRQMGRGGKKKFDDHFEIRNSTERLMATYQQVLQDGSQ